VLIILMVFLGVSTFAGLFGDVGMSSVKFVGSERVVFIANVYSVWRAYLRL
jgi:hypothetical protein